MKRIGAQVWCRRFATTTALVAAAAAGCGSQSSPSSSLSPSSAPTPSATRSAESAEPTSVPSAAPTPTSTTSSRPAPNAADTLAAFFTEATRADGRVRAVAAMVNGEVGTGKTVWFRAATIAAARAAHPDAAARAIPPGLPPRLLTPTLLVYSDLVARAAAFDELAFQQDRDAQLRCLRTGATPAARFPADLWNLRSLAAATPPVTMAAPDSRAAAELAVQLQLISLANNGCGGCGGRVFTQPPTVRWHKAPATVAGGMATDGTVNGIGFAAQYSGRTGWTVTILAC